MDITFNDDQVMLQETALAFAKSALAPVRIRALEEDENGFDRAVWKDMARMGWVAAPFPETHGGAGVGMTELGIIVEALGQAAIPSPLFSTVIEAGLLLLDAGSPEQKSEWLPAMASGEAILTTALLESGGALGCEHVHSPLTRSGNGFELSGLKLFVRDAGCADRIICVCRSGSAPHAVTLAMVSPNDAGVQRRRLRAAGGESLWEVKFESVRVGSDQIIGEVDGGWPHIARLIQRGAAFKAAELVGIGQASLDLTLDYAKSRVQFGRPIGSFQGVHHHCAEMYRDLVVCRLLAWRAAASLDEGIGGGREIAIAKAKASAAVPEITRKAHQIHGAAGYYRDYPLELYYHRAVAAMAAYGDPAYHRRILSELMKNDLNAFRGTDRHELPVYHV